MERQIEIEYIFGCRENVVGITASKDYIYFLYSYF